MKTEQTEMEQSEQVDSDISLLKLVPQIWKRRYMIMLSTAVVTVFSIVTVLIRQSEYTAETSILPELEKNKLLGLSGISDLASVTGLTIGETPVSKLYPMIISSARILTDVIDTKYQTQKFRDSVTLADYWFSDERQPSVKFESALKGLQNRMDVVFDNRLGTLTLKLEMEEPKLAADVANRITLGLDSYTRTKRKSSVTLQREFIEQRLAEIDSSLRGSEDKLKLFREMNRRVLESPQLLMEQGRKERDVQINSAVFVELKKQMEVAKIEEIKNIPVINILDSARVPIRRSSPRRTLTVVLSFFLSLIASTTLAGFERPIRRTYEGIRMSFRQNQID